MHKSYKNRILQDWGVHPLFLFQKAHTGSSDDNLRFKYHVFEDPPPGDDDGGRFVPPPPAPTLSFPWIPYPVRAPLTPIISNTIVNHELCHVYQHKIKNSKTIPAWFKEGMAMYFSKDFFNKEKIPFIIQAIPSTAMICLKHTHIRQRREI